jgi:hypothetical protein
MGTFVVGRSERLRSSLRLWCPACRRLAAQTAARRRLARSHDAAAASAPAVIARQFASWLQLRG